MAAGDVVAFDQFRKDIGAKLFNFSTDTWKLALITTSTTPLANMPVPHFGGTGTTNLSTNEVAAGGNYTTGGIALDSVSYDLSGGKAIFKAQAFSIAQNASNPTNARWGIIYNSTDASKKAMAFVDFGVVKDLTATTLELRWNNVDGEGEIFEI